MKHLLLTAAALSAALNAGAVDCAAPCIIPAPREMQIFEGNCKSGSQVVVEKSGALPSEGYEISVSTNGIAIRHGGDAGLFYANATLDQLKEQFGEVIPCMEIKDSPRFRWRGVHLDESRHFFGKATVKRMIALMARYKFNVFHWHLADDQGWRIDVPGYPELVKYSDEFPGDGNSSGRSAGEAVGPFRYTERDIREIVAYAKQRHVTIIPEIEFPGHFYSVLCAYPEFACNPANIYAQGRNPAVGSMTKDVMCAGSPDAIRFVEKSLDRVCELFPSKVIHIGGDECPKEAWSSCPKCLALAKSENLGGVEGIQPWLTRRFAEYLKKKGRRAIGWDEIFAGDTFDTLPGNTMGMLRWHPDHPQAGDRGARAVAAGRKIVCCPHWLCYFDYSQGLSDDPFTYFRNGERIVSLEKAYSFDPLFGIPPEGHGNVLGGMCDNWTEFTHGRFDLEWKLWPRALATAEVLWTYPDPAKRDFAEFSRRAKAQRRWMFARHVNCAPVPERTPGMVRLMEYNIRHGAGADGRLDCGRVAEAVRRENPDFVALNEVDSRTSRVGGLDVPEEIGRLAGLNATFAKAIDYKGGGYGNAVLSREKPLDVLRIPLPGREPRVLLLCEFQDCWFGTMHLDFGIHQFKSVDIVRGIVVEKSKTKPVFITGDWNNTPDSKTLAMLREFMTILSGEKCRTFHGFMGDKISKTYCIDYIAVDSAHADAFAVLDAHVTPDEITSDHNPVFVAVELSDE